MEATDEGSAANDRRYAMLDQRDIPRWRKLESYFGTCITILAR